MKCVRCHRTLTDPVSIKAGIGPICKKKDLSAYEPEVTLFDLIEGVAGDGADAFDNAIVQHAAETKADRLRGLHEIQELAR